MFKDHAVIYVRAGKGGDGASAFLREKYVNKGGPAGGDGGHGGGVYLIASDHESTLLRLVRNPHIRAEGGVNGANKNCHGKKGEDVFVKVPVGTLVFEKKTNALMRDLKVAGDQVCVAEGGNGGWGNARFVTATNQAPRRCNAGLQGESRTLRLELRLIADIGLVGMPNAGKSTLITRVSAARPKVADYPFTTLEPHPGIVELDDDRRFVIMDIPGLVEGAAEGHGLGHRFLKHIERTRALVHLIDMAPTDGTTPEESYRTIAAELERYSPALAAKPRLVAYTKADLVADPEAEAARLNEELGIDAYAVSAVAGLNLRRLLEDAWKLYRPDDED